jgi:hypothetical protein
MRQGAPSLRTPLYTTATGSLGAHESSESIFDEICRLSPISFFNHIFSLCGALHMVPNSHSAVLDSFLSPQYLYIILPITIHFLNKILAQKNVNKNFEVFILYTAY